MPGGMVWPPPKVLATPEGEITVERPQGAVPEVSAVVAGVTRPAPAELAPDDAQSAGTSPPSAPASGGAASEPEGALPGVTVSVMAANSVPQDWLARPEGLLGCVLGSRYRITSVIGRGPMGIACEGESSRGRQVTLKLLPCAAELPVEHFAWQMRQAIALAHFDHVNVTPISDFGPLEDGGAFVSRARVPGVTLRTVLRQGPLPIWRALDIARQIASALAAAHAQEIAHGRLKPENIVLSGGARRGDVVKVVDFGMAGLPVNLRAVAMDDDDARRLALRTRLYLPADVTGASPAIDVYSLGVMSFEMIAGQPPFVFESLPPPGVQPAPLGFAQTNPSLVVPPQVAELVFAMMHPQATEHGLSAERVEQLLDELLGRPSVAPPEPATSQRPSARPPAYGSDRPSSVAEGPGGNAAPNAGSLVWPVSPPPAPERAHSFPPLPRGLASSFPPPALEAMGPSETPPAPAAPRAPSYPTPPSARRAAARVDVPFASTSFPPPSIAVAQPPAPPNATLDPALPTSPDPIADDELELRPSFIGRLKRMFGKKPPSEF
jgi:eukaryotic-like serine/threonine-protein kinase